MESTIMFEDDQDFLVGIEDANDDLLMHYIEEYEDYQNDLVGSIEEANDEVLMHYGVGHEHGGNSGRYPWGSGEVPHQHDDSLAAQVKKLKAEGVSESERAKALGFVNWKGEPSTGDLRAALSFEKNERKKSLMTIPQLSAQGLSDKEIAERLHTSLSNVRLYKKEDHKVQLDKTYKVAEMLKKEVDEKKYLDIGPGTEYDVIVEGATNGVSANRMDLARKMLEQQGYKYHKIQVDQVGNPGKKTTIKVLGAPDTDWATVQNDPTLVKTIQSYAKGDGEEILGIKPIQCISSDRIKIHYGDDKWADGTTGADREGVIQIRRGVEDLSLGGSMYSQVRVGVDGSHYLKGMAVYSDNVPDGYDVVYNTTKKSDVDKYDVFKKLERKSDGSIDMDNPFGSNIKRFDAGGQSYCLDQNGNETDKLRAINKVNDEGDWGKWNKTISAQMLSKQPVGIIHERLALTYDDKVKEFDEICKLTNPSLKRSMLESFADDCDSATAHLKARGFNDQTTKVLIAIPSLKPNEVYAPTYTEGDTLALVRFPHADISEIPKVKVNNHNAEALAVMKNAPDAIGLHPDSFQRLSGADADGDTVVCIPLSKNHVENAPQLKALVGFDSKQYKVKDIKTGPNGEKYDPNGKPYDSRLMNPGIKQTEMGKITNLIADMGARNALPEEKAKAIKHSMVIIDAVKHDLDYQQSAIDNDIQFLKEKYQDGGGASTFITRAGKEVRVNERKLRSVPDPNDINPKTGKPKTYYGIDPVTGEKAWIETGNTYKVKSPTKKDPDRLKEVVRQEEIPMIQLDEYKDARDLMSSRENPHPAEVEYANYANKVKELANRARLELIHTEKSKRDPDAAREYASEVEDLMAKVTISEKRRPRERQAQIAANAIVKQKLRDNPAISDDKDELKKLKNMALRSARSRMGVEKFKFTITDKEWDAIQAGALSATNLEKIFKFCDKDELKQRATPRATVAISDAKRANIKAALARGMSIDKIAENYDVSASTVVNISNE